MSRKNHLSAVTSETTAPTTISVHGITVPVSRPYAEGHACTSAEAIALNQMRTENLRNNFAARVRKALPDSAALSIELVETLRSEFTAYEASYSFAAKRAAKPKVDAVTRESHKIAKGVILEALRKANTDPKTLTAERMEQLVLALLAKRPDLAEEAERRIAATRASAEVAFEDLMPEANA